MPTPAERLQGWIDGLSTAWKDRLQGWASGVIGKGGEKTLDVIGTKTSLLLKALMDKMDTIPNLPPELKPFLDELRKPTGEAGASALMGIGNRVASGSIGTLINTILSPFVRDIHDKLPLNVMSFDAALELWKRGMMDDAELEQRGRWEGLYKDELKQLRELSRVRLPSDLVLPLWLRDPVKYNADVDALQDLGLSSHQLSLLKELQMKMPGVQDVVTWLAREVFEPAMIAKYGLDDEWAGVDKTLFGKIGLTDEMALNYWRAHWQHASWTQVTEMLHRRLITEEDVWDWFRLVEIPPYWRDNLIKTAYRTYTRVDIRRMWDLGVLDDGELYDAYRDYGYNHDRAMKMVLWTKVYQMTPQLIARYKNGYINEAQVKAELVGYGLAPDRAQWVWETKVKKEAPERVADTRTITVAEIVKAVKQQQVDLENGVQLIESLGYEDWEARFKLGVALYSEPEIIPEERTVQIDTIRRRRRARYITRDQELNGLLGLNLTSQLATAYADNDDLRLVKAYEGGAE